jgi:putative membrane protein
MQKLVYRWLILSAAILCVAWLLPGIHVGTGVPGVVTALVGGAILGVLNWIVRPILIFLSCPLVLLSLGLFLFIINAALLLLASSLSHGLGHPFYVDSWGSAIIGSILITIVSWFLSLMFRSDDREKE